MPHLSSLYNRLKPQNVGLVAMNYGDDAGTIKKYWSESGFKFPAVIAADKVHQKFGVMAYPTNYVLDGKGKVVARFVGFNEEGIKKALRSQGVRVD